MQLDTVCSAREERNFSKWKTHDLWRPAFRATDSSSLVLHLMLFTICVNTLVERPTGAPSLFRWACVRVRVFVNVGRSPIKRSFCNIIALAGGRIARGDSLNNMWRSIRVPGKTIARPNRTISKRERSTRNERRLSSPCLAWRDLINRTLITESSCRENSRSARLFSTKSAALPVSMRLISCLSLFSINARNA